jgi:4,5-DOPA dioxygenase extradiol
MGTSPARLPVLFVSHGAPSVAVEEDDYTAALRAWGAGVGPPAAVVTVSAHWPAAPPVRVTTGPAPATIHDFSGFPPALYRIRYPARGAPALAARILDALRGAGFSAQGDLARGLDHGSWVPLRLLFPAADVPVVAVSLPAPAEPEVLCALGAALAPLRDEGVLVVGSGGVVHNLGRLDWRAAPTTVAPWAREFDAWVRERVGAGGDSLLRYATEAPHARFAVPTTEHFDPLFVVLGAAAGDRRVVDVYQGFRYGTLSMRTFALCP